MRHHRHGEEPSCRWRVPVLGDDHVDDLAVLVDAAERHARCLCTYQDIVDAGVGRTRPGTFRIDRLRLLETQRELHRVLDVGH